MKFAIKVVLCGVLGIVLAHVLHNDSAKEKLVAFEKEQQEIKKIQTEFLLNEKAFQKAPVLPGDEPMLAVVISTSVLQEGTHMGFGRACFIKSPSRCIAVIMGNEVGVGDTVERVYYFARDSYGLGDSIPLAIKVAK